MRKRALLCRLLIFGCALLLPLGAGGALPLLVRATPPSHSRPSSAPTATPRRGVGPGGRIISPPPGSSGSPGAWSIVPSANPDATVNILYGVAAFANNDVWAVGQARPGSTGNDQTLVEHYDGANWSAVASPSVGDQDWLRAVATVPGTHQLWAVGYYYIGGGPDQALIEHYDGTTWSVFSSPQPGTQSELYGIVALSDNDVWAVGDYVPSGSFAPLIEHYDGTSWSVVTTPSLPSFAVFYAVSATASNDVWAVGFVGPDEVHTLIEHYDGTSWSVVPSANRTDMTDELYAVSGTSHSDVWAAGYDISPSFHDETLIEHYDGTSWSLVPSPNTTSQNYIYGLAALAPNNVWAVGYQYDPVTGNRYTLILHYDGGAWSAVPSPNPPGTGVNYLYALTAVPGTRDAWAVGYAAASLNGPVWNTLAESLVLPGWKIVASPSVGSVYNGLNAVAAASSNDVWAAGASSDLAQTDGRHTLIEHWTGSGWSVVASPNPGAEDDYLTGLKVVTSTNVWAVGASTATSGGVTNTLALQWNGASWSAVPTSNVGSALNVLTAIGGTSATDLWAVGYSSDDFSGFANQTLVEHYNGTSWSVVPSPNIGTANSVLNAVVALSPTDAWAAGTYYDTNALAYNTLIEHWDGTQWSVVPSPNPGNADNELFGLAAVTSGNVWAVGKWSNTSGPFNLPALIEHWNGTQWSVATDPQAGDTTPDILFASAVVRGTTRLVAVGVFAGGPGNRDQTLIQQWDGAAWSLAPHANPGGLDASFRAIAVVSACNMWAVGIAGDQTGHSQTLVERYIAPSLEGACR